MTRETIVVENPKNYETTLSAELLKLSFGDRNEIEEEIHGVRCRAVKETPELVKEALDKFDLLLNQRKEQEPQKTVLRNIIRISKHGAPATDSAACYLNEPDVRLRFLRCTLFVVDKAVERFVLFLEVTAEIFGDFVAERPIQRSDFTGKEKVALKKSRTQLLPFRDRSGRRILTSFGHGNYQFPPLFKWKTLLYFIWSISRDTETQQKGVVFHYYPYNEGTVTTDWKKGTVKEIDKIYQNRSYKCLPVRPVGFHLYLRDTPIFRFQASIGVHFYAREKRLITKVHFGEQTEVCYKMASFGVPVDVLPITSSGAIKFSNHCNWLDAIEQIEKSEQQMSSSCTREIVVCPLVCDVVFRTGATPKYNPGNAYYRELIQSYSQEHMLGDSKDKYKITKRVWDEIVQGRNGRFLEWSNEKKTWMVIKDPEVARAKIAKSFKHHVYVRPKKKLEERLDLATSVVDKETNKDVGALQEYYSKPHSSKRLKTSGCAYFISSTSSSDGSDSDDSGACFGKTFFLIND